MYKTNILLDPILSFLNCLPCESEVLASRQIKSFSAFFGHTLRPLRPPRGDQFGTE